MTKGSESSIYGPKTTRTRFRSHPTWKRPHPPSSIMADNSIPESYDDIVQLLEDAADGAATHGATIGLKQNDEPALRAALTALVGTPAGPGNVPSAVPGLKDKWNTAKAAKTAASASFNTVKRQARSVARACIGVLKPRLGDQWNNQWQT